MIKEETSRLFSHIDAKDLLLWKVSEAVDENLESNLKKSTFTEQNSLSPVDKLSQMFSDLSLEGHLQVVVGYSDDGKLRVFFMQQPPLIDFVEGEQRDTVSPLSLKARRLALCHAKKYKAPSSEGQFDIFRKAQEEEGCEMFCGRPVAKDKAVPASLFHETLSKFQHDLTHCTPTPDDIHCFTRLRFELTEIFLNEAECQDKMIKILREENVIPLGGNISPNTIGTFTTDGDARTTTPGYGLDFLYFVQEIKNEFSTGKAEPYMEAIHYWWAHVLQHILQKTSKIPDCLNFPAILLVNAGTLQRS